MTFLLQQAVDQEWWLLKKHWNKLGVEGRREGDRTHTRGETGAFHTLPLCRGKGWGVRAPRLQHPSTAGLSQLELRAGCSVTSSQQQLWARTPSPSVLTGPWAVPRHTWQGTVPRCDPERVPILGQAGEALPGQSQGRALPRPLRKTGHEYLNCHIRHHPHPQSFLPSLSPNLHPSK